MVGGAVWRKRPQEAGLSPCSIVPSPATSTAAVHQGKQNQAAAFASGPRTGLFEHLCSPRSARAKAGGHQQ